MIEKADSISLLRAPPDRGRSAGCGFIDEAYRPVGMSSRVVRRSKRRPLSPFRILAQDGCKSVATDGAARPQAKQDCAATLVEPPSAALRYPAPLTVQPIHPCIGVRRRAAHPALARRRWGSPLTLVFKRRTRVQRQNLAKVLEDE